MSLSSDDAQTQASVVLSRWLKWMTVKKSTLQTFKIIHVGCNNKAHQWVFYFQQLVERWSVL
jgi:hypothetical protein